MQKSSQALLYFLVFVALGMSAYALWKSPETAEQSLPETADVALLKTMPNPGKDDSLRLFDLPEELTFAGEKVPLDVPDVKERLEREIYVNAYWQSNMILLMKRSSKYLPQIEAILAENQVPEDFKYLAMAESALMNVTSPAGARGFWQIMEGTAKDYGLEVSRDVDERYHLAKSTTAATKYLNKAHRRFGDWTAVAASYNIGQAGFERRQRDQFAHDYYDLYLNEETSRYLFRILAFKVIFENPGDFGFHLRPSDYYQNPTFRTVKVDSDINNLAAWAKDQGSTYKELKLYNPWLRDKDLNVRRGKSYQIQLPE
ncbi:transglycosylase SLT domain-containing protein [Algoriphagus halophytocola]|uniref:Transglycosylase SLT domain-containing protein n=1 Tax=Algoriphagus halophytocola TaxID=2991499 RepID=A0ABY6MFX3_9BACT|nr:MULTISPECIES: lytic transglycosylase domain-containing protein [unclassified Algoriphagus]UZD21337.1 transglycosylase SLT domain-containing protein [Algoriphagus sp. TR-M5]WBL42548.1 transglycosylase SLT domain-containing protein [Algoriphagus sp. TR-M9]